jgi:chaperonin GroEL
MKDLNSKIVGSIVTFGTITKINGSYITINNGGDSLKILLGSDVVVKKLNEMQKPVEEQSEIEQVGSISANNEEIGKIISNAMEKVGRDGIISIGESSTNETILEFSDGMEFDKGYVSSWFINDVEKFNVTFENCYILLHEERLEDIKSVLNLLNDITRNGGGRPILIVAVKFSE